MMISRHSIYAAALVAVLSIYPSYSFVTPIIATPTNKQLTSTSILLMADILSLTLTKPLGLILEESEDTPGGVIVTQVNEGGSAFASPSKESLISSKIASVNGKDVSALSFDDVMNVIIEADTTLEIDFSLPEGSASTVVAAAESLDETAAVKEEEESTLSYDIGQQVTIIVQQPSETNKPEITLTAKVGDNLRKTLLANKEIELYRGLKKKLGNCGGGGQCGFCAVELEDNEGVWGDRSDYEATKIGKNGSEQCRLACMNNIVGPCTVKTL